MGWIRSRILSRKLALACCFVVIATGATPSYSQINVGGGGNFTDTDEYAGQDLTGNTLDFNQAGAQVDLRGFNITSNVTITSSIGDGTIQNSVFSTSKTINAAFGTPGVPGGTITFMNSGAVDVILFGGNNTNFTGTFEIDMAQADIFRLTSANAGGNGTIRVREATLDVAASTSTPIEIGTVGRFQSTLQSSSGSNTASGTITLGASINIEVTGTQLTLSNAIGDGGNNFGITKQGDGTLVIGGTAVSTYTGDTTIEAGVVQFGMDNAIDAASTINLDGGTLDLNGFSFAGSIPLSPGASIRGGTISGTVTATGGTISNSTLSGDVSASGTTISNSTLSGTLNASGINTLKGVSGSAQATMVAGGTTILQGRNSLGVVDMQGDSTIQMSVPTDGTTPLTVTSISSGGGTLELDASALNQTELEGEKTLVSGEVDESVAANTTLSFEGVTEKFKGFGQPLEGTGLYNVQLKKGSIILSIQRKGADDICGVTGLCTKGKATGKLSGLDRSEVRALYGDVVLPALESRALNLPFWTTKPQISKYLMSGLMPRNIDAPGTLMASYNNRMADALFEQLPAKHAQTTKKNSTELAGNSLEKQATTIPLMPKLGGDDLKTENQVVEDKSSVTSEHDFNEQMQAWVRGFGGEIAAPQTTRYLYQKYTGSNSGGAIGIHYMAADDFQVGIYANYGDLAMNTVDNAYSGSGSWRPNGWGGGVTAHYWTDSYYVQGLLGTTVFSGDQDRSILTIDGIGGGKTLSGYKSSTSLIGALRAGIPAQLGDITVEPHVQATWSGNQEHAFHEGGNSDFKLKYKARQTNFIQTELGLKVAYPFAISKTEQLIPSLRLAWLGDWDMNNEGQKIGYQFSPQTIELDSHQSNQNGALIEAGLDYAIANIGSRSLRIYGRGGAEVWDNERGTNWRGSGGFTLSL